MSEIRVRFAPSPTGYLHIGGARTALFNWLYARHHNGRFILRIEDTDKQRSSDEMVRGILEGMAWLGLNYDEGPFFQSDYYEEHRAAAQQLLESGHAYRDFTPKEERTDETARQQATEAAHQEKVFSPLRNLSRAESDKRAASGEPFVIRFKVPEEGMTSFEDAVYGLQQRDYKGIEDLVLLRSDGHPLYNLSVVCDDINMGITHVIRGQDHLTNTHKQVLIYQALGKPVPTFAHLPLILAPNKGKLSKRKHGEIVSVTTYRDAGFIPDAFANFLALLGWSPVEKAEGEEDREIFSREELIAKFSLEGIHKANAVFNFTEGDARNWTDQKALWMNQEYIKTLPMETLFPMVKAELQKSGLWRDEYEAARRPWFEETLTLLRERARTLNDFTSHGRPYFVDDRSYEFDEAAVKKNLQKDPALKELLPQLAEAFASLEGFTHDGIEALLRKVAEEKGVKVGLLTNATRTALTGQAVGPGLFSVIEVIGKKRTVERLRGAAFEMEHLRTKLELRCRYDFDNLRLLTDEFEVMLKRYIEEKQSEIHASIVHDVYEYSPPLYISNLKQLLTSSLVTHIQGLLDVYLPEFIRHLSNTPFDKSWRGSVLDWVKHVFKNEIKCDFDFGKGTYQRLKDFYEIRNDQLHHGGYLSNESRRATATRSTGVHISQYTDLYDIEFSYCRSVIDDAEAFLSEVKNAINSK